MWMPNRTASRVQRTPSVHSVASIHSPSHSKPSVMLGRNITETKPGLVRLPTDTFQDSQSDSEPRKTTIWQSQRTESEIVHESLTVNPSLEVTTQPLSIGPPPHSMQSDQWEMATDDDATSRSSTLDGEEDYLGPVEKRSVLRLSTKQDMRNSEPQSPAPAAHVPGPLESQLAALMSKLIHIEHANPTISISPDEHEQTQKRLQALEEEKRHWWKRHEAIWALRDEDVGNNIKIRGLLAKCRRELEMTQMLRDEDLLNVQLVRAKLADKTRELERFQAQTGRISPNRGRPGSFFERRGTSDLFVAAKTAALEQRALELEKRNSDLVAQVETLKGGASIDDLNRFTAHQAWKDTVGDLEARLLAKDAELKRIQPSTHSSGGGLDWYRIEALLEEHASYREAMGGKLQALRSDKEILQRELHRKENECQTLELKLQGIQRRSTVL